MPCADDPVEALAKATRLLVRLDGELHSEPLAKRARRHGVPGVGVAAIEEGRVAWEHSCGVRRRGEPGAIDAGTLFQASSLSKLATALASLRLVGRGVLDLDRDLNDYLTGWQIPENAFTRAHPVTLRTILSHSSGLSIYRYHGYAETDAIPSLVQILNGDAPALSDPVTVAFTPGTRFGYSEGAMAVEQLLLGEVTGMPFPELMRELVLDPLGMRRSDFAQPLPPAARTNAAAPHGFGARSAPESWRIFPEMAASGLWSSPGDIARMLVGIRDSFLGRPGALLDAEIGRAMLMPSGLGNADLDFGLGPWISGVGPERHFGHAGVGPGFNSLAALYLEQGCGVVVMTNGANGSLLIREVVATLSEACGWPGSRYRPSEAAATPAADAQIGGLAGRYRMTEVGWGVPGAAFADRRRDFVIAAERRRLVMRTAAFGRQEFVATGRDEFLSTEGHHRLVFARDPVGFEWLVHDRVRGRARRIAAAPRPSAHGVAERGEILGMGGVDEIELRA